MSFLRNIRYAILSKYNRIIPKDPKSILFMPHPNCLKDGYDILNGQSDNVLCLFNSIVHDSRFNGFHLYVLFYHADRLPEYIEYCKQFPNIKVSFVLYGNRKQLFDAVAHCYTIFTATDCTHVFYRTSTQRIVCLNYYGGIFKSEFHRWEKHGGFKKVISKFNEMYKLFDNIISLSELNSKLFTADLCHYYPHFLPFGFPRNDIFFQDMSNFRKQVEEAIGFSFKRIITYVPTHRDYENHNREAYDENLKKPRSIWGHVGNDELIALEKALAETDTIIIAKVHPIQKTETSVISYENSKHIIFYNDLIKKVKTSLNPIMAISDSIITDYTSAVFDFLYTDRPIIYYFYDIELYRKTRGFFIEPIEAICAGHFTYGIDDLQKAIREVAAGSDPQKEKRHFLQQLLIKFRDGNSSERIKNHFFPSLK